MMKAYLETVVVTQSSSHCERNTSVSQIILEFEDWSQWDNFNSTFDAHEKAPGFEIYRTLLPLW